MSDKPEDAAGEPETPWNRTEDTEPSARHEGPTDQSRDDGSGEPEEPWRRQKGG